MTLYQSAWQNGVLLNWTWLKVRHTNPLFHRAQTKEWRLQVPDQPVYQLHIILQGKV